MTPKIIIVRKRLEGVKEDPPTPIHTRLKAEMVNLGSKNVVSDLGIRVCL